MTDETARVPEPPAGVAIAELVLALGVIALGLFFVIGAGGVSVGTGYDRIGPRFFPYVVGGGLVALGLWQVADALRGRRAEPAAGESADPDQPTDWGVFGLIGVALVLDILLMERAGFVLASSLLFLLAARAFGSRRPGRDALVAVLLSAVTYLVFTRGLGLTLPAGVLGGLL